MLCDLKLSPAKEKAAASELDVETGWVGIVADVGLARLGSEELVDACRRCTES